MLDSQYALINQQDREIDRYRKLLRECLRRDLQSPDLIDRVNRALNRIPEDG